MRKAGPWILLWSVLGAATGAAAGPEALQGDRFITVMQNNTLSGATAGGARYDMYFLPGGLVTYRRLDRRRRPRPLADRPRRRRLHRLGLVGGDLLSGHARWRCGVVGGQIGSGRGRLRGGIADGTLAARSG